MFSIGGPWTNSIRIQQNLVRSTYLLIRHLDPLNGVCPVNNHQSTAGNNVSTDINTDNHPFSCQIADLNAGWGSHVAEDIRLVGPRNLPGEFEESHLRPSAIAQN